MLNVGVIGVGSISTAHINAYLENENVNLLALCDINSERLKNRGEYYGISNLYTDHEEILRNEEIDAVSICTWNDSHAEIAIKALKSGKHVLVEKPPSITYKEALAIQEAVHDSGKTLQIGFVRRHGTNTKVLKQFIDNGSFGEIYYAKASCLRRLGNPGGWFSNKEKSGGGPLIDLGVHFIDHIWYLMGKPRPVSVSGNIYHDLGNRNHIENLSFYKASDYDPNLNNVEDLANALIRFENGASLYIDTSFTLHAKQDVISSTIFGDKGGAEIEPELSLVMEENNTILNMLPQLDDKGFNVKTAFSNEINHFVECCKTGLKTIAPIEDGIEIMKILNAIYKSAELGKEIKL